MTKILPKKPWSGRLTPMSTMTKSTKEEQVKSLFKLGAHFGYDRARQHPSTTPFIFGYKNRTAIIDLEKTVDSLEAAKAFAYELGSKGKKILFVGSKNEAMIGVKQAAQEAGLPYVINRWLGGTLTNIDQMRKRIALMTDLKDKKVKGELAVYKKKERLMIDKKITDLDRDFTNLGDMKELPAAMFVVDVDHERIAVKEAGMAKIPVISLANSDCNLRGIAYPIVGNDSSKESIAYFAMAIAEAYNAGKANPAKAETPVAPAGESVVAPE